MLKGTKDPSLYEIRDTSRNKPNDHITECEANDKGLEILQMTHNDSFTLSYGVPPALGICFRPLLAGPFRMFVIATQDRETAKMYISISDSHQIFDFGTQMIKNTIYEHTLTLHSQL